MDRETIETMTTSDNFPLSGVGRINTTWARNMQEAYGNYSQRLPETPSEKVEEVDEKGFKIEINEDDSDTSDKIQFNGIAESEEKDDFVPPSDDGEEKEEEETLPDYETFMRDRPHF